MKVLVIGGAGYIGSVTVEHLLKKGHQVIVLDNLLRGHVEAVPSQVKFIEGDMGIDADLDKAMADSPDAVMHFAALSLVGESVQEPAMYYANNVANGMRLLDAMRRNSVNKIVFSSTAAVYGEPQSWPIDENFPHAPTNPYGETKLAFEKMLRWYENAYGLQSVCLRYFNAAGATEDRGEDHHPETHLIPVVLQVARGQREKVTIFGDDYATPDGTCIRDYIHVSDLADAHLLAVEHLGKGGESATFNLGSENGFSVKEVIDVARKVTGHPIPTEIGKRRAGDPAGLVASSSRIKKALGWQPTRTDLATIIGDAWKWHQKHPTGYKAQEKSHV